MSQKLSLKLGKQKLLGQQVAVQNTTKVVRMVADPAFFMCQF